jgi:hypothetical protein
MQYVLGNMLNGAGGLNADGLALDLQFAADKTLTARKGPTPVFTRGSTGTFVGSNGLIQSAAINTPRFDHTAAGVCRGLLIEESRTNLCLQSEDMNSATWGKVNGTISNNFGTSPDGTTNADKFVEDSASSGKYFRQANLITIANSTVYTWSVYAKADGRNFCSVQGDTSSGFLGTASFDLLNGTVGAVTAGTTATIQSVGSGWYRLAVTSTSTGTGVRPGFLLRTNATGTATQSYQGDGVSGVLFWGAQLEAGSFATSYIPTTTGSVVRSADVCSITGANFTSFYNQSEGTMLTNAFTPASGDRTVLAADDNTANEMIRLRTEGTNPFFKVTDGGSELVAIDAGTVSANTSFKLIGAYKLDDFASSINGGAAVTDTSGTTPTVDRMRIGAGQGGNTMCGCVASLRYYKKRLPNAKLQALTA